jgi:hypothetical protein
MSEPVRLLSRDGGATDFERELLGAWEGEQPTAEARAKVLAIAGLAAGAAGVGAATAAVVKAGGAGSSIAPKALGVGAASLAKWIVVGTVAAAAAGVTVYFGVVRNVHPPVAVAGGSPAPRATLDLVESTPLPPVSAALPALSAPGVPEVSSARGASPSRRALGSEKAASDEALGEEVSLLDHARRALAGGDPPGALRQLDAFDARFPRGSLAEEAEVLRVEALLAEDDRASATKVAARFLAAHPTSPHAARIRALLARDQAPRGQAP